MSYICRVCNSKSYEKINTYKHFWYSCNDCGSTFSIRKDSYLFSNPFFSMPIKFINKLCFGKLRFLEKDYLKVEEVISDESQQYSVYAKLLKNNDPSLNARHAQYDEVCGILNKVNVDLHDKKILVLSGGPGILSKDLEKIASKVVTTEYSSETVTAMREVLGLDVTEYDINTDKLEEKVDGLFDVVLVISVVNFCNDLGSFIKSLKKVLAHDGVLYINIDSTTLAYVLFLQFDEYTPTAIYHKEVFLRMLAEAGGFTKIVEFENKYNAYFYRISVGGWKNKVVYFFRTFFWILFGIIALLPHRNINREFCSKGFHFVFRYNRK